MYGNNYNTTYGGGYMMPQPSYTQYNSQPIGLKGRPVSSIEEVRAAQIDFDGSLFVFPDIANKKIYTKQINLDGTAAMKIYVQVDDAPPAPAYVTKEELASTIQALKQEVQQNATNAKSTTKSGSNNAALTF